MNLPVTKTAMEINMLKASLGFWVAKTTKTGWDPHLCILLEYTVRFWFCSVKIPSAKYSQVVSLAVDQI